MKAVEAVDNQKSNLAVSMDWQRWIGGSRASGLAAAILFLGVANGARASALIDVQFTEIGSPSYSGAAVLGSAGDNWNTIRGPNGGEPSASGLPLTDVTGASTGVTLGFTTGGQPDGFYDAANNNAIFGSTSYAALLDAYLYSDSVGQGAGTVTLSGLTPGADYQLVLYSVSNTPDRETDFTVGGTTQSVDTTTTTTLTAGVNYTDFTVVADSSGDLDISFTGPIDTEGDLNGLQLQALAQSTPVPEPAGTLVLGSGLVLMLVARRPTTRRGRNPLSPRAD